MATVKRRATIKVDADVKSAIAGMKKTSKAVRDTEEDTARLNQTLRKLDQQANHASATLDKKLSTKLLKVNKGLKDFASKWGFVAGAAGAATAAIAAAVGKMSEVAHESLKMQAAFSNVKFGLEDAAEGALGLVDNFTLAQSQVKALELGAVTTKEEFDTLVEAGAKLGLVMSGDATQGVEDLTTALARGSQKVLDNLGIMLTQKQAITEMAALLGKEEAALTASERAGAFRTIGLIKAKEAADAKVITDGKALALIRAEVALQNELNEVKGGAITAQGALNIAIAEMGDSIHSADVSAHGESLAIVERTLTKYGHTLGDVGGAQQVNNRLRRESIDLLDRENQERQEAIRLEDMRISKAGLEYDKRVTTQLRQELEIQEALGAGLEVTGEIKDRLNAARLEEARSIDRVNESLGVQVGLVQHQINLELIRETKAQQAPRRRGGGRRKKQEPLEDLLKVRSDRSTDAHDELMALWAEEEEEFAETQAHMLELRVASINERKAREEEAFGLRTDRMDREIEFRRAMGEEVGELESERTRLLHHRAMVEGDINTAEELAHKDRMRRLKEEQKEQEKRDKKRNAGITTYTNALGGMTIAAMEAADGGGKAFLKEAGEFAVSRAKMLSVESVLHTALGVGWAIAGNPIKAGMEFAAAGSLATEAAVMGALALSYGLATAGGGGSLAGGGADFGGASPSTAGQESRPDSAGTAPISPLEQSGQPAPASGAAGGGVVINIQGSLVDSGGQLLEMIEEAQAQGFTPPGGMG